MGMDIKKERWKPNGLLAHSLPGIASFLSLFRFRFRFRLRLSLIITVLRRNPNFAVKLCSRQSSPISTSGDHQQPLVSSGKGSIDFKVESNSAEMSKKMHIAKGGSSTSDMDSTGQKMDIKSILKDIEFLGHSHMTWKEKKELENRKVVSLGGKPQKKQRLPLSVARVMMKNQKEREQKKLHESSILGRFGGNFGSGTKRLADKRKPEDRVLKSTVGHFRSGVLDVKHLLLPVASSDTGNGGTHAVDKGKRHAVDKGQKRKGGKKNGGKKKGGGKNRH